MSDVLMVPNSAFDIMLIINTIWHISQDAHLRRLLNETHIEGNQLNITQIHSNDILAIYNS